MRCSHLVAALVFLCAFSANAKVMGEWETAGATLPPYDAPYEYKYLCQVEINDNQWETLPGDQEPSKVVGVAQFEVNSDPVNLTDLSKLKWEWVRYYSSEIEKPIKGHRPKLSFEGNRVEFALYQNFADEGNEYVSLKVTAGLRIGDMIVPRSEIAMNTRKEDEISAGVKVTAYEAVARKRKQEIKLFTKCWKRK